MNRYKDTTQKPNTLETQKKWHSERFINAFLDCLLMAGMVLFILILATYCQPARATYDEKSQVTKSHRLTCENTSQLTYENTSQVSISQSNAQAYRQALHKHSLSIGNDIGNTGNESGNELGNGGNA